MLHSSLHTLSLKPGCFIYTIDDFWSQPIYSSGCYFCFRPFLEEWLELLPSFCCREVPGCISLDRSSISFSRISIFFSFSSHLSLISASFSLLFWRLLFALSAFRIRITDFFCSSVRSIHRTEDWLDDAAPLDDWLLEDGTFLSVPDIMEYAVRTLTWPDRSNHYERHAHIRWNLLFK